MTTLTPDQTADQTAPDQTAHAQTALDGVSRTSIRLLPDAAGGRARLRMATGGLPECPVLRPMLLDASDQCARVSLVPEGAMLLAADRIDIDIEVGAGTRLEIIEPAGTVAYDMRGRHATWDVRIRLAAGSTLVWAGEPFVAAAGSDVRRTTTVELGAGARLALRETLVLGRYGEWPGRVKQSTRVSGADGSPLLAEDLDLDPVSAPHLIGRHRVVSSVLAIGGSATPPVPDDEPCLAEHRYDLESGGALWRRLGTDVHATQLTTPWAAVR